MLKSLLTSIDNLDSLKTMEIPNIDEIRKKFLKAIQDNKKEQRYDPKNTKTTQALNTLDKEERDKLVHFILNAPMRSLNFLEQNLLLSYIQPTFDRQGIISKSEKETVKVLNDIIWGPAMRNSSYSMATLLNDVMSESIRIQAENLKKRKATE